MLTRRKLLAQFSIPVVDEDRSGVSTHGFHHQESAETGNGVDDRSGTLAFSIPIVGGARALNAAGMH